LEKINEKEFEKVFGVMLAINLHILNAVTCNHTHKSGMLKAKSRAEKARICLFKTKINNLNTSRGK